MSEHELDDRVRGYYRGCSLPAEALERKRRGWSQSELSRRSGLNSTTICEIENRWRIPRPSQLAKIADALDWRLDEAERLLDSSASITPSPGTRR